MAIKDDDHQDPKPSSRSQGETPVEPAELDTETIREWRSIVTLIVFVVTNITVLLPFYNPLDVPRALQNVFLDKLAALRITQRRRDSDPRPWRTVWDNETMKTCWSRLRRLFNSQIQRLVRLVSTFAMFTVVSASPVSSSTSDTSSEESSASRISVGENTSIAALFAVGMAVTLLLQRKLQGQVQSHFPAIAMLLWNAGFLEMAFNTHDGVWESVQWGVWLFTCYVTYEFARLDYSELRVQSGPTTIYGLVVFMYTMVLTALLAAAISSVATLDVPALVQLPLPSYAVAAWSSGQMYRYWFQKDSQNQLPQPATAPLR